MGVKNLEIYLDNAATTKVCKTSSSACVHAMTKQYGNASSLHRHGFRAENLIDRAKLEIANLIFADVTEIVFTSGATESNNLAIIGSAMANIRRGKKIVTTAIEHPSVLKAMEYLEKQGFEIVKIMPDSNGEYTKEAFIREVDENTILVSVMMVNNETGLLLPIDEIATAVKKINFNTVVHVDAVQGFMKLPIKVKNSGIDLLSFSGHKVYAPKGVGGLYIKRGVRLINQSYGGSQQGGVRAGTEPVQLISALAGSVKENACQMNLRMDHYVKLKSYLIARLSTIDDVTINSTKNCVPYIVNFSVKGIRSEIMLHYLEGNKIYVSSGSACSKGRSNYVLLAFMDDIKRLDSAIRVSFSGDTTIEMLDILISKIEQGISELAHK